jgi:hypothetical protein
MLLTTNKLREMSLPELNAVADEFATRLSWQHQTGKDQTDPEGYKRLASELYHIAQIIEQKETELQTTETTENE